MSPGNGSTEASEPSAWRSRSGDAFKLRLKSWLIYVVARLIYISMRMHIENFERLLPSEETVAGIADGTADRTVDRTVNGTVDGTVNATVDAQRGIEGASGRPKGVIQVTWHGRTLIPANLLCNRGYWALISLSRDGELQNHVFCRFGFQTIRGSTGRGGVRGALQMARKVREGGVLAFTPDGPRGPSHKVQLGVILMAQKSGAPIVPVGISASRRWLIRSWDQFMIPKPFARGYFLVGEPIYVPAELDEAGREAIAEQVEIALNRLEREAERRAGHPDYPDKWRTD